MLILIIWSNLIVLYVNFYVKCLKFITKWSLSNFKPIVVAILVTIAMVNVKLILDFYTWPIHQ